MATSGGEVEARAGVEQVADDQADGQRDRRHRQEVAERQAADLADLRGAGDRADAEHDRAEDDRRDHHLDQADEGGADRLELDGEVRGEQPDGDAEQHRDDHREVEVVGAVASRGAAGCGASVLDVADMVSSSADGSAGTGPSMLHPVTAVTLVFVVFTRRPMRAWATMRPCPRPAPQHRRAPDPGAAGAGRRGGRRRGGRRWPTPTRGAARSPAPRDRALAVAVSVADTPQVREALRTPDPTAAIQPFAEEVRRDSAHRLRGGDGRWTAPATRTPTPPRSASRSSGTWARRTGRAAVHPGVHRHARALDARGGAGVRDGRQRPGRRAGLGRHHHAADPGRARRPAARPSRWRPGWSSASACSAPG